MKRREHTNFISRRSFLTRALSVTGGAAVAAGTGLWLISDDESSIRTIEPLPPEEKLDEAAIERLYDKTAKDIGGLVALAKQSHNKRVRIVLAKDEPSVHGAMYEMIMTAALGKHTETYMGDGKKFTTGLFMAPDEPIHDKLTALGGSMPVHTLSELDTAKPQPDIGLVICDSKDCEALIRKLRNNHYLVHAMHLPAPTEAVKQGKYQDKEYTYATSHNMGQPKFCNEENKRLKYVPPTIIDQLQKTVQNAAGQGVGRG